MVDDSGRAIDRVDVGIVVAMPLEADAVVDRLRQPVAVWADGRRVTIGRLGDFSIAVMAAGVGGDAAVRGVGLMADGHRPGRLVAAGLCGGLDPGLARSAIIVADRVGLRDSSSDSPDAAVVAAAADHRWLPVDDLPAEWQARADAKIVLGPIVTSDRVVGTVAAKQAMRDATAAAAVDMESWWVVDEARRLGLPVHVIRAVCDTATETVPADIASLATAGSAARLAGAAVRMLWNRPASAIDMVELRERAHTAADALALRLEAMLARRG